MSIMSENIQMFFFSLMALKNQNIPWLKLQIYQGNFLKLQWKFIDNQKCEETNYCGEYFDLNKILKAVKMKE